MKKEFKYKCLHIPTKKTINRVIECRDRIEFLEHLNNWNRLGFGLWQYSESYNYDR